LRSPAGRAMPCIKLLPLPPPSGRHWPFGGFQQCGVCVLSSCCSLSVARRFFVLAWYQFSVSHAGVTFLALSPAQVRGPSGLSVSSPRGWCRASQGESSELCPSIPAGPYGCCCVCCFAWVIRSNRGGGLCAPWMWMMCVSMFPSVRLAACVSSCWLRCLRVGIRMYARPCARGMVCDAFGGWLLAVSLLRRVVV